MKTISLILATTLLLASFSSAYTVPISDADDFRQACSGIWDSKNAEISVYFDQSSSGQAAVGIWEWSDVDALGKFPPNADTSIIAKSYVCTTSALQSQLCEQSELGKFIVDKSKLPEDKETSIWTAAARFSDIQVGQSTTISDSDAEEDFGGVERRDLYKANKGPFHYDVPRPGFYCVGSVPITLSGLSAVDEKNSHASFSGIVTFNDAKKSQLPAADIPKLTFYLVMVFVYIGTGMLWAYMCYQHRGQLLMVQHLISGLIAFLVAEMLVNWGYYKHLDKSGNNGVATFLLCLCATFAAVRSAASLGLVLSVSLGWAVVKPSLDRSLMKKIIALVTAHALFGIVNAIGTVIISFEDASIVSLICIIIPLAVTQSIGLLWTIYALQFTIKQLESKHQQFKLKMYRNVYRILIAAQMIIIFFFGFATFTFSSRLEENYEPNHWKSRWFLIDGWTTLLYYVVLVSLSYLWKPSSHHSRLALSEEIAVNEEDVEEYEIAERGYNHQTQNSQGYTNVNTNDEYHTEETVFAIEDDDDNDHDHDNNEYSHSHKKSDELDRQAREREELLGKTDKND
ncbi:hypothetical protein E3P99_00730 [Wallemia hederae]|uniref:Uncharacterized protein n=1 Tax=Wallemia hederae TaxID=1540922 RepID=A0A4T0FVG0_9BASI|nr:hypothetical protein E3P99_00730 [Wallemia hederae]